MPLQEHLTDPQAIWDELKAGNERFAAQQSKHPNDTVERRTILSEGQNPRAVVLACSDSRVPVELLFDVGLGDVFVIRTAGEIVGLSVLASLEYAVESLGCPLVIVMGHEFCGAVGAAMNAVNNGEVPGGFTRVLIERVSPSVMAANGEGKHSAEDVERIHVAQTVAQLFTLYPALKERLAQGTLGVIGARYRISDNKVETVVAHGVE
ncbi:carbonic anhydrase [Corynebacterium poyangense]|uniref:Carbonic anhydrase n=1 Tax=Corynebacterium poyangense TaxID=2684405 RepID=A0A7H0SR38_9CORY|nr:carbonic anhydrase [Corynebacterium poyangense]MBZ8176439.1 carbonic anhydrase [Corynebacterium poyangense]QNQ91013.1 carbonic anhydrase [Corynebacterium poyangense]